MYEAYWKLSAKPFRNAPGPAFFFHSPQHEETLMKLTYAVNENMGAAMVTGVYGCGKTFVVQVLLEQLGPSAAAVFCNAQPQMSPLDLLRLLARGLRQAALPVSPTQFLADAAVEVIEKALEENARDGRHTVVVIDEAHLIEDPAVLETTRLLLNFQNQKGFMLTLLLLGHPELAVRVSEIKQMAQRIPITCRLDPLDRVGTEAYVLGRLAVAGRRDPVFTAEALDAIHSNSGGIPRRINTLCDVSLAVGAAQAAGTIHADLVLAASRKFGVA